jgi:hypothetical protein
MDHQKHKKLMSMEIERGYSARNCHTSSTPNQKLNKTN